MRLSGSSKKSREQHIMCVFQDIENYDFFDPASASKTSILFQIVILCPGTGLYVDSFFFRRKVAGFPKMGVDLCKA